MARYRVQFVSAHKPGTGYIDGYATAKRAKQVVANVNAQEAKDNSGVTAKYLGASIDWKEGLTWPAYGEGEV